jgi:hypothetical protein
VSIFRLAGLAGTGKSTVIRTFCERVSEDDRFLLASFFASRNSAERRDPLAILHTFAYDLAIASNRVRPHVLSALRSPQDILDKPMHEQVEQLLAGPIGKAQQSGCTIVFAIDALDECQKDTAGVEGGRLIQLLTQALQHQPVKLVISSRQEASLEKMFRSLPHATLRLHEVGSLIVAADVRRILNAGFENIRRNRADELGADPWPTESDLAKLVNQTGPFFIYASTVLKFVDKPRFFPNQQLNRILACGSANSGHTSQPFSQIDSLYTDIIISATTDIDSGLDAELCQRVGDLLRTVVLLEEPVSILALAHLTGVPGGAQQIDKDVHALASVLLISTQFGSERFSETVSTFHPSFRDFLVDPKRCPDSRFLIRPAEHQQDLLHRCLRLLNSDLRYDICGIKHLGQANADIQDLSARLVQSVPQAVSYACLFWPVHLVGSKSLAESVGVALLRFCRDHLFHWLEVLSLLGKLSSASVHLPRAIAWCQVSNPRRDHLYLIDSNRVI